MSTYHQFLKSITEHYSLVVIHTPITTIKICWIACLIVTVSSACHQPKAPDQEKTVLYQIQDSATTHFRANNVKESVHTRFVILNGYEDGKYWLLPISGEKKDSATPVLQQYPAQ